MKIFFWKLRAVSKSQSDEIAILPGIYFHVEKRHRDVYLFIYYIIILFFFFIL